MSDTRPVPAIEASRPRHRHLRLRNFRVRTSLAWHQAMLFTIAKRSLRLIILQLFGALSVLVGISFYSIPAALIVGGLGAILAAERQ